MRNFQTAEKHGYSSVHAVVLSLLCKQACAGYHGNILQKLLKFMFPHLTQKSWRQSHCEEGSSGCQNITNSTNKGMSICQIYIGYLNDDCFVWWQSDSAEYQQADALWELFLELKTTAGEFSTPAVGNDDDDDDDDDDNDDNSRMSSVTDDTTSRSVADIQVTGVGPKVMSFRLH